MKFTVRPEVKIFYPSAHFGSLTIHNQNNQKQHPDLEQSKRQLEEKIRETYLSPVDDEVVQCYADYYGKWGKTYHIEFQINSIKKGRGFPNVSTHVDSMFMAELENRILTSGHDADTVQGSLIYDLADNGEEYVKLNGKKQSLLKNDIVLRDEEGVLASILFGPAARTSITMETLNPLFFAWCPIGITPEAVETHLSTILGYMDTVYGETKSTRSII
jgi:DNA/RNA-binding domain of Phe-tRNA-synthetase-like protein